MHRDIVLVPTFNRPELLALCLEHLAACPEIVEKDIWVRHDSRSVLGPYWSQTVDVVEKAAKHLSLGFTSCGPHSYPGNSYNVLSGYWDAWMAKAERIYLVEDDVLVSPDFFRWHDAIMDRHDWLFCSVGWHCLRRADVPRGGTDPLQYFLSRGDYASIGVCWRRDMLERVVEHVCPGYFEDPARYLKSHFPNDPLSTDFSEQDGLIMRVLGAQSAPVAWPILRRAHHVGWYGYHRPDGPKLVGEIEDKIREARQIVNSPELLKKMGVRFGGDTDPVTPESAWKAEELRQKCL